MVLKKCANCKKNVTKKMPGLECSRCERIVHADPACAKLSNKQLNTLRNSTGIEWSCEECQKNTSRRTSYIIPDEEDEDGSETGFTTYNQMIDTRKLVQDISREIKKTFREEIGQLECSLQFLSDQVSTMEQSLKIQDSIIKDIERKNLDLQNKNKNLELRVSVLEQEAENREQRTLSSSLEIAGLPEIPPKELNQFLKSVALKLDMDVEDIQSSKRLSAPKDKLSVILVEMKTKTARNQWISAGKEKCLTVGDVIPEVNKECVENRIYIREALTRSLKTLLHNTKSMLRKSFQFIWCKDGKICVRRNGNSKIYYIRNVQDIIKLQNKTENSMAL
ncbi:unnamed protein product [Euphydryas editha]|uniref:Zinc finger DNA binding protein n=1 Tax=Euphydryas editha TaxID=104508 RepID=A0AAU9TS67_EUPED|nr:unnamed protein product [Euphydryas editha]